MKCPHCEANVELDTKMYFKSFIGKYKCSSCTRKFKLQRGIKYYAWIAVALFIAVIDSYFVIKFAKDTTFSSVIYTSWLVILFFTYCHFDRKIENKMPTIKIN